MIREVFTESSAFDVLGDTTQAHPSAHRAPAGEEVLGLEKRKLFTFGVDLVSRRLWVGGNVGGCL